MIFINHKLVNGIAVAALVGCTVIGGVSVADAKVSAPATMVAYNTSQEGAEHLRDGYVDRAAWQTDFDAKAQEAQGINDELQGLTAYLTQEQRDNVAGFNVDNYSTIAELQAYIDEASSWKASASAAYEEANSKPQVEVETSPASSGAATAPSYSAPTGGGVLTPQSGVNWFNGHKETYYNLDMSGVIANAQAMGIQGNYWVRGDGVKMYGDYVIVAAQLPKGTIVATSLGTGIVLDYCPAGTYDIAVVWG